MRVLSGKTAVLLAATVAAVSLTAVAAGSAASETAAAKKVTLTYFTFSAAPDHLKELQAIVQAFERSHPNTRIKILTASYNDYWTKLQTMVAGGRAPDIFELNYESFVTYAESGRLLNIAPIAKADRTFKPATYYPRAYQAFQLRGKQYALPETFSVVLLFYNKTLFRNAGVAFPTASWRWQHELAAAKQLTNRSQGIWGDFQPVQFWEYYKVLAQNNGTFFNPAKSRATFNSARGVTALNWLLNKTRVHGVMPTKEQMGGLDDTALFKSGRLAMWHNGIWQFDGLKDAAFDWDVTVEPGNARKGHHFFSNAVAASAKTKYPGQAWAFMRFFTANPKSVKIRVDSAWELPAVANRKLFARYLGKTPPANREAVFDALNAIVTPPVVTKQTELQDIVNRWLEKAATDSSLSAADTLNGAAGDVNRLLASGR
jgi:multiple sugar transport system substrate-binding protein